MLLTSLIDEIDPAARPWPAASIEPITVVLGEVSRQRDLTAARILKQIAALSPGARAARAPAAADWPFTETLVTLPEPTGARQVFYVPDLHLAFINHQTRSTRLVTTQAMYLLQVWADVLASRPDLALVATADPASLRAHAAEALDRRGPWRAVAFVEAAGEETSIATGGPHRPSQFVALSAAFGGDALEQRVTAAGRALDETRTPPLLLTMASVCMEANDLENAGVLLAECVAAAPQWAAGHFEYGKYWLRRDDMRSAAEAFGRASDLMPGFASAAANWGATLGELDRPDEAWRAFERALAADPENAQAVNNVGVVTRELGRLSESEAAFRRVIALTPDLAFGHYNLGHTLFLQGRYQAALSAYMSGQRKDPEKNPVQASRLALARLATGDAAGALRDLQLCTARLPPDYRRQVLSDTQAVAWALLSTSPGLDNWRVVGDWLAAELNKP